MMQVWGRIGRVGKANPPCPPFFKGGNRSGWGTAFVVAPPRMDSYRAAIAAMKHSRTPTKPASPPNPPTGFPPL
ncbi:hypothetical protein AZ78_1800 [Lysobacter capsici AZ78]|uniref:Uncharacterized protein n=1 Tax=Lysobacter capsici AZ78 TaxID=1444315 RepID=A0A125MMR7_9GAMM|nr:hypothetical protein AZ78_1800 [Lysobacter capsici AZ78]